MNRKKMMSMGMTDEKEIRQWLETVCGSGRVNMMVDGESDDRSLRFTSFENNIDNIIYDFKRWILDNKLTAKDVWYADLYCFEDTKKIRHIGLLFLEPDNVTVRLEPAPEGSKIVPLCRKPGLKRRIRAYKAKRKKRKTQENTAIQKP